MTDDKTKALPKTLSRRDFIKTSGSLVCAAGLGPAERRLPGGARARGLPVLAVQFAGRVVVAFLPSPLRVLGGWSGALRAGPRRRRSRRVTA